MTYNRQVAKMVQEGTLVHLYTDYQSNEEFYFQYSTGEEFRIDIDCLNAILNEDKKEVSV